MTTTNDQYTVGCEKCGQTKGALYRQNPKGRPGIWRCIVCTEVQPDPALAQVTAIIESMDQPVKH